MPEASCKRRSRPTCSRVPNRASSWGVPSTDASPPPDAPPPPMAATCDVKASMHYVCCMHSQACVCRLWRVPRRWEMTRARAGRPIEKVSGHQPACHSNIAPKHRTTPEPTMCLQFPARCLCTKQHTLQALPFTCASSSSSAPLPRPRPSGPLPPTAPLARVGKGRGRYLRSAGTGAMTAERSLCAGLSEMRGWCGHVLAGGM